MARATFQTIVGQDDGTTGTFLPVPIDVRGTFGRARPKVRVTVGGHEFRSTIAVFGGESFVPLDRANREAADVAAGDTVTVTLETDDAERTVDVPPDLAAAIAADAAVQTRFEGLASTRRLEYARWIEEAKRPETRRRRITLAVERIGSGR